MEEHFSYRDSDVLASTRVGEFLQDQVELSGRNTFLFCSDGKMTLEHDGQSLEVSRDRIFFCPPGARLSECMFAPDFRGMLFSVSDRSLQQFLRQWMGLWNQAVYVERMYCVEVSDVDRPLLSALVTTLSRILSLGDDAYPQEYRKDLVYSTLRNFLVGVCCMVGRMRDSSHPVASGSDLFQRFLALLDNTPVKRHPVEWYAERLSTSTKTLGLACREHSCKSAMQWIREYTLSDVRHYLRSTDIPIKEVSMMLGFPNTSFFGQYVKEHLGTTPLGYRQGSGKKCE